MANARITLVICLLASNATQACVWDADTLLYERIRNPDMARIILGSAPSPLNAKPLVSRIEAQKPIAAKMILRGGMTCLGPAFVWVSLEK